MRNLKWADQFVFIVNSVLAFMLFLSYSLPYISPSTFPLLSVLSLAVPILIVINMFFLMYWILRFKKQMALSLIILLLGASHISSLYRFGAEAVHEDVESITLLSYNVHQFNRFKWITSNTKIPQDISEFVASQRPTIFCAQEYYYNPHTDFSAFQYKYIDFNNNDNEVGQAIYSQLPIINQGTLKFEDTANNAVFVDVVSKMDTLRVYNVHFQSHRINPDAEVLQKEDSQKLLKRIGLSFEKQQTQMEEVLKHMESSPYKRIVMGDFNNTAYSYIYNQLLDTGLRDAFKEAGGGFGKTFNFRFFPTRIDFILVDETFEVIDFENFEFKLSDHYPILAHIKK